MKQTLTLSLLIGLLASTPASAQLLGGGGLGGGLGGSLGGSLGGTLGGAMESARSTISPAASGSVRGEKSVNTRSGNVQGSGSADGSVASTIDGIAGPGSVASAHSVSGSASGRANADLIGTDAIFSSAGEAAGTARSAVGNVRDTAGNATGQARGIAGTAPAMTSGSGSGIASGGGSATFLGNAGQLAAIGSAAANGSGMFSVVPGMNVTDAKGRVIGEVVSVGSNARGVVQSVVVEAGNEVATLPAANFAGSGSVLVTGMSKSDIKSTARDQEAQ